MAEEVVLFSDKSSQPASQPPSQPPTYFQNQNSSRFELQIFIKFQIKALGTKQ
jgi:hypothetical protein